MEGHERSRCEGRGKALSGNPERVKAQEGIELEVGLNHLRLATDCYLVNAL